MTSALQNAINEMDYGWLESQHPRLLMAIVQELQAGKMPADIKHQIYASTTADRQGLAVRCFNAACYIYPGLREQESSDPPYA